MEINIPEVVGEVTAQLARYEKAIAENNVAVLTELFWNSSHTIRYGIGEQLYGYDAIANYRAARTPVSLARTIERQVITTFGRDFATATIQFKRDGKIGRQMQAWARMPEGWRVVAAHVSYQAG